jgi:PAS domain S-box-containing protein
MRTVTSEAFLKKALIYEHCAVSLQVYILTLDLEMTLKLRFWSELAQKSNLQKLFRLGSKINDAVQKADLNYIKALNACATSSKIMREYSKFLLDVCNDISKSEELHVRASQVEELKARSQVSGNNMLDLSGISSDRDLAMFSIDHKGIILSANAGVRAMFGYEQPDDLVGQNISSLVPPPFNKIHDSFLSRYLNAGEGNIISKVRKIFAMRADGFIIPVG